MSSCATFLAFTTIPIMTCFTYALRFAALNTDTAVPIMIEIFFATLGTNTVFPCVPFVVYSETLPTFATIPIMTTVFVALRFATPRAYAPIPFMPLNKT